MCRWYAYMSCVAGVCRVSLVCRVVGVLCRWCIVGVSLVYRWCVLCCWCVAASGMSCRLSLVCRVAGMSCRVSLVCRVVCRWCVAGVSCRWCIDGVCCASLIVSLVYRVGMTQECIFPWDTRSHSRSR